MSERKTFSYMTAEEYLKAEETATVRHEYVDGSVFAMTGANRRHNVIAGNIFAALHGFLDGSRCQAFMEAFKARVKAANCFYYPDVMVVCGHLADESVYSDQPVLIVEVLSPSTAAIDRREKLVNYMKIPALQEFLLVHQRRKRVEMYRRNAGVDWEKTEIKAGETLVLESLPVGRLSIPIDSIYRNVQTKDGALEVQEDEESEGYWVSPDEVAVLDW